MAPSLVTCPTRMIAVPVCLAWRVSCAAHSRTCATEPGAESALRIHGLDRVITRDVGFMSPAREDGFEPDFRSTGRLVSGSESRRARSATCAPTPRR